MLTRREFITGAAKVFAGGIAAASGVLAIVPVEAEAVHPLSTRFMETVGGAIVDGMIEGIEHPVLTHYPRMEWEYDSAFNKVSMSIHDEMRMLQLLRG